MTEIKSRIARVSSAYEPDWGGDVERVFRRTMIAIGLLLALLQLL